MRRHSATRRRTYGQRLHALAERMRGHAPQAHQPTFEAIDDREVASFLRSFGEREAARLRGEIQRAK